MEKVEAMVLTHEPDVLNIKETWLLANIQDDKIDISNYHKGKGGRYVKKKQKKKLRIIRKKGRVSCSK